MLARWQGVIFDIHFPWPWSHSLLGFCLFHIHTCSVLGHQTIVSHHSLFNSPGASLWKKWVVVSKEREPISRHSSCSGECLSSSSLGCCWAPPAESRYSTRVGLMSSGTDPCAHPAGLCSVPSVDTVTEPVLICSKRTGINKCIGYIFGIGLYIFLNIHICISHIFTDSNLIMI